VIRTSLKRRERHSLSQPTRSRLQRLKVTPSKSRGQNFVVDDSVIEAIISFRPPSSEEHIVEIGPGLGALTSRLTGAKSLTLIEVEDAFCEGLVSQFPHARLIHDDARKVDLSLLPTPLVVYSNLPYSLSTDMVFHLIEHKATLSRAVLLLQREFAERMGASPGSKSYGVLSVMVQMFCEVSLGPTISGDRFFPPTEVMSRVLELTMRAEPFAPCPNVRWFRHVVRGAFLKRRKMLHNSLRAAAFTDDVITYALKQASINPSRRGETLTLQEFSTLARALKEGEDALWEGKKGDA
jgi:16S rRNA (adenine1518-N6/adenine1519-N6)-dimethyltransferase